MGRAVVVIFGVKTSRLCPMESKLEQHNEAEKGLHNNGTRTI